jgi:putative hydrolase of the HAD superfamily
MHADLLTVSAIDAVILDLGGVICRYDFDRVYSALSAVTGLDTTEVRARLGRADLAHRFERGELDAKEFVSAVNAAIGTSFTEARFAETWNDIFLGYAEGIEALVPKIAARTRLVCLSNTNVLHAAYWREAYAECLSHVERIFTSHELGARKPEREAYLAVVEYLNLPPWRTAFFDDMEAFVEGARAAGLRAYRVTSSAGIARDLAPLIGAFDADQDGAD